ncbi:unnamed protein product (macronuclear) [Paramecium tetraurelia]|uniref:RGS domain-containing protein n=1 Tax=Paramecium tetraurelia TaxID=5888 RepID=A0DR31_PARTE|nr:uncharacterized protein GSPATT00002899001 [Paramecium tetraurelia]CAK85498.1 unnamed protein product [Paramecium tetraurelia]|eukprot:XP_001452895.1 hypothetical protein (macronuclear) [Paramecium tetraurelia strain d4-2]
MHANNTSINDHTPTFAENQDFLNVEQCLNGISDFLLYTSTLKLDQSNHLTNYFLEDKQASKNFSSFVNDIEFSELIRSYRLHRYYNKLNGLNNSVIIESHHQKVQSSNRQSQPQVVIKIIGTSPPKIENKKYSQIESRYSPKNLKFYLKQEQQSTDSQISQSRRISSSIQQSRSSSLTMSSITSNIKFQQVYQNQKRQKQDPKKNYQFCLLSQKHQELTKQKQKNEPNKILNLSLNSLSSKIEKNK